MTYGVATIPADQITPADLRAWHVVEVTCLGCSHTRVMRHDVLKRAGAAKKLSELPFRCQRCPEGMDVKITVMKLPRNF